MRRLQIRLPVPRLEGQQLLLLCKLCFHLPRRRNKFWLPFLFFALSWF
jgi:hypothetical protein